MPSSSAHAVKIRQSLVAGEAATSDIAASWQRCLNHFNLLPDLEPKPDVLTRHELDRRLSVMEEPIRLADADLKGFARSMAEIGGALSLTDSEGATLITWATRTGLLASRKFQAGAIWSEATQGTNGVGTCLEMRRPISISLDKHFFSCHSGFSCIATPIFSPVGAVAGTLNVAFANGSVQPILSLLLKGLVEVAQKLEALWFGAHHADCMIVSVPGAPASAGSTPLAAVTASLSVSGATYAVRHRYKLRASEIALGLPLRRILPQLATPKGSLKEAELDLVVRTVNQLGGQVGVAATHLGLSRATLYRKLQAARGTKPSH